MTFNSWLNIFVSEKQLNTEHVFQVPGKSVFGDNFIPLSVVLDAIKKTTKVEQQGIKTMIVKIDFVNGNVMDYFKHLAQALAV